MSGIVEVDLKVEVVVPSIDDERAACAQRLVNQRVVGELLVEADLQSLGGNRSGDERQQ